MRRDSVIKFCKHHGNVEHGVYEHKTHCRPCQRASVKKRRAAVRDTMIDERGGACESCGYNKCRAALDWHHLDPSKKDFHVGDGNTRSIAITRAEVAKCKLLCANCHREAHDAIANQKQSGTTVASADEQRT